MKPALLYIIHSYVTETAYGGTETHTNILATQMMDVYKPYVVYTKIGKSNTIEFCEKDGIGVCTINRTPESKYKVISNYHNYYNKFCREALKQILETIKPSLIHVQHSIGWPFSALRLIEESGIPYIVSIHDFWWICPDIKLFNLNNYRICNYKAVSPQDCASCLKKEYRKGLSAIEDRALLQKAVFPRKPLLERFLAKAKNIIVPSRFVKEFYVANQILSPDQITVIEHGVSDKIARTAIPPHPPFRFAALGNIVVGKGTQLLLESFVQLNPKDNIELHLHGNTSFEFKTDILDPILAADSRIVWHGAYKFDEINKILADKHVIIAPSVWNETFGMVIRESLAAGRPIIISNRGAYPEHVPSDYPLKFDPSIPGDLKQKMQFCIDSANGLFDILKGIPPSSSVTFSAKKYKAIYGKLIATSRPKATNPRPVTIVIPVYGQHKKAQACIDSILMHTKQANVAIVVIDDASGFRISSSAKNITIKKNIYQMGWLANCNAYMENAKTDILLMNSDTIVSENWLEKLQTAAYSDDKVGITCPVSNNATILSIPGENQGINIPQDSIQEIAKKVDQIAEPIYPSIPVAIGFCMYIKKTTIDTIGILDTAYDPGYSEDNDYSMRAKEAGLFINCADDCFVYHEGAASHQEIIGIEHIKAQNDKRFMEKWGEQFKRDVSEFIEANPLEELRRQIKLSFAFFNTLNSDII